MSQSQGAPPERPLPEIPLLELGARPPVALVAAEAARAQALMAAARRSFTLPVLALGDPLCRRWLARNASPYRDEIAAVAEALPGPGAWMLNLSHEWACTSGVAALPGGRGCRLLRALDWPLPGLGRHLLAVRRQGPAGPWIDLTWPGFVGALQGLAPGRFAAAFNQAPLARRSGLFLADWALQRRRFWRSRALPPAHLLRLVFEQARSYAEARDLLAETPLALPVIYALAGPKADDGCIIERLEESAAIRPAPAAAANHWQETAGRGYPRGLDSSGRAQQLSRDIGPSLDADPGDPLAWVRPPVLNELTRLALAAEPATGRLAVQGFEADGPATAVLEIAAEPVQ